MTSKTLTMQEAYALGVAVQALIHGDIDHAIHMILPLHDYDPELGEVGYVNGVFASLFEQYFDHVDIWELNSTQIRSLIQHWLDEQQIDLRVIDVSNMIPLPQIHGVTK